MARAPSHKPLVIDARPRGPHGPIAEARVLGRTVIEHLIDAVGDRGDTPVSIHARENDHNELLRLIGDAPSERRFILRPGPPPEGATVLRADRLYDPGRLRRALRSGRSPEAAVVWRLDRPHALAGADDELLRRRTYQPLGRFWALAPARLLARRLVQTKVRPNHLTIASGTLMLASALLIAFGPGPILHAWLPAALIAIALVLDTSDGHLARLQGTASPFGSWLDANLDELGDMALHAGVAWSLYAATGSVGWLLVGMAYGMGKYLFMTGQATWDGAKPDGRASAPIATALISPWSLRGFAHWLGHADVRLHLWIALAALGRLDIELVVFMLYYPGRTLAGGLRKAVNHEPV